MPITLLSSIQKETARKGVARRRVDRLRKGDHIAFRDEAYITATTLHVDGGWVAH